MGVDADAVIDSILRVHGVRGLRVADASVMPSIVAARRHALVTAPRRSSTWDAPTHVPAALQIYTVEAPDLSRYDALLVRASA
jgi:choline dehydrogenase